MCKFATKLMYYLCKICALIRCASKVISEPTGAILIEFAVCMPVLLVLLFYVNDLVRVKRYKAQTEFVAYQIANFLQNITQNKNNKAITQDDLNFASMCSWLTVYPGDTFLPKNGIFVLGHNPRVDIFYVQGQNDGSVLCIWEVCMAWCWPQNNSPHSPDLNKGKGVVRPAYSVLRWSGNKLLNPFLSINPGEYKVIIETSFMRTVQRTHHTHISLNQAIGTFVYEPELHSHNDWRSFFNSVVAFSPKQGLFNENTPP